MKTGKNSNTNSTPKAPTGIQGLDEITFGGLPKGRSTLVCGGPGCGKTLLAMQFVIHGATMYDEPGVFVAFEETEKELEENFRSLGYHLDKLTKTKKIVLDHIQINRGEIEETGEYDLEGLFIRLGAAIDAIGAKRIALDTIEVLFGGLSNTAIIRSELSRLFRWLKDRGMSVIVTGERGEGSLTRFGIEEYVSDCVIVLDHRVNDQIPIRRLRVLKYRGSVHGTNEYPYLIDEEGFSLQALSSISLNHKASRDRISTGIHGLDLMLEGKGFYRGSSILVSGTAGTGKSSIAAHFAASACERNERALYFAFEESESQMLRNFNSIGLKLEPFIKKGLLRFHADRPSIYGLEMHLVTMFKRIRDFKPRLVIIDPITNFIQMGSSTEVRSLLTRLIDSLKVDQITAVFTSLTSADADEGSSIGVSSIMDSWVLLRSNETGGVRDHGLYILKSRGMSHSNGIRQFRFTSKGIVLQ